MTSEFSWAIIDPPQATTRHEVGDTTSEVISQFGS
jgi:hypothetical protein